MAESASITFGDSSAGAPAPTPDAGTPPATDRPAWLPAKFKTAEDMAKSYAELEKTRIPAPSPAAPDASGLPLGDLTTEYQRLGRISDETLTKLEKKGIPRVLVEGYIRGQEAFATQQEATLAEAVNGSENLRSILSWAEGNLTADEVSGYNALIEAGNLPAAKVLLKSFSEQFAQSTGSDPISATLSAGTGNPGGLGGYGSSAEMVRDMSNKKYQEDSAFRAMVRAKLAKTTAF